MKRLITIFALVAALAIPASSFAQSSPYAWTVSASAADPMANTTAGTGTIATYYLWFLCADVPGTTNDGMAAAEFALAPTGVNLLATTPVNGFLNAGSTSELLLAVGACPGGPVVAANLLCLSLPGRIDIAPSSANGVKGTVDCEPNPILHAMDWIGLGVSGPNDGKGDPCNFVSVEESSWGTIKGLYR
jgi:hypothetical protein